jgi:DNA-binding NtrC family response regulator
MWKKKRKLQGKNKHYSLINKLKREHRLTDEFQVMFNCLSLEEVIALKLELASKSVGGKLLGFPIWASMHDVTKDAVLKYALSAARTKGEVARFLGIQKSHLNQLLKKYETETYFEETESDHC